MARGDAVGTVNANGSTLTKQQYKSYGPRPVDGYGKGAAIWAHVRHDDECGNGHNSFAITGTVREPGRRDEVAGGCLHDDIAKAFPELAPLIRFHLFDTDGGPMHYIANAAHLAGDRDCWGRAAGEASAWETAVEFAGFPLRWRGNRAGAFLKWLATAEGSDFELTRIDHEKEKDGRQLYGPKWTLGSAPDKWHECPFDTEAEGLEFLAAMRLGWKLVKLPTAFSDGKPRELDAARWAACWPDATDEELTAPGLEDRLKARLPGLMVEFRAAVESLGFTW